MAETYNEFKRRVIKATREKIKNDEICIDGMGNYFPDRFDEAVENAISETIYWEGYLPDFEKEKL